MDRFEFQYLKSMVLGEGCDKTFEQVSPVIDELQSRLNFGFADIEDIIFRCPSLCDYGYSAIKNNIDNLSKKFSLLSKQFRYLVLKYPFVLLLNRQVFDYKIDLLSTLFAISKNDVFDRILQNPELLFISKEKIINQVEMLSVELNDFGLGIRRMIRLYPDIIFVERKQIKDLLKVLLYDFSFSINEAQNIFKAVPNLLLKSEKELKEIYNYYYPKYFVKRDFKEMVPLCPEFLMISKEDFEEKLSIITNAFSFSEKEACEFIRGCPNLMFYKNLQSKFDGFKKFNINMEFIKIHPSICMSPEISIPLKFILARMLCLDSDFEKICSLNTKTFVSRFLYMQDKKIYNHQDLLLSEDDFLKKYSISSKMLRLCYPISSVNIENICKYYLELKERLPKWSDVAFPKVSDIEDYLKEKIKTNQELPCYCMIKERYNFSKHEYDLVYNLLSFHLDYDECMYLINKCPALARNGNINVRNQIDMLRKYGVSLEDIIRLAFNKPALFTFFIGDFDILVKETVDYYKCDMLEAITKVCG